jgi:rRNA maturation RNase YbeY
MAILIDNRQKKHPIILETVKQQARAILNALEYPESELSILITDDEHIAQLNQAYLNHQGPTNVISFPMQEGQFAEFSHKLLGDVVISIDTAAKEAAEADISLQERFYQLLIHGILHLVGYDHVNSDEEAEAMESKSQELLKLIVV